MYRKHARRAMAYERGPTSESAAGMIGRVSKGERWSKLVRLMDVSSCQRLTEEKRKRLALADWPPFSRSGLRGDLDADICNDMVVRTWRQERQMFT